MSCTADPRVTHAITPEGTVLSPDELRQAVQTAEKSAGVCRWACRVVAEVDGGERYICSHNGLGNRDTDAQTIHSPAMLALSGEKLAEKLRAWIVDLHSGNRLDLNAT